MNCTKSIIGMLTGSIIFRLSAFFWAVFIFFCTDLSAQASPVYQTARNGKEFKIFQFPRTQMPRIDGHTDDWSIVPDTYVYDTSELKDTEDGMGSELSTDDLDVAVTIGWVKGLNRLYILYEAYDDYWDFGRFNPNGYLNDIFEIVVDGDLSGGPFIFNPVYPREDLKWDSAEPAYLENHFSYSGVHAQNYHIYTPPVNNAWTLIWGSQHWISEFPYANYAYDYNFKPGESGKLILEAWITPYDYATWEGPQSAIESQLKENKIIGLSWSILDFDGGDREGHVNLSHNAAMVANASLLCAFRLMPLEAQFEDSIRADWTFEILESDSRTVSFRDQSVGQINNWYWDFDDGTSSTEQNPIHRFSKKGVHKVITLEVEGPAGSSKRTRYWEVMIR